MAYPATRSCVSDLRAGMTDGAHKKAAMNRGGVVEDTTSRLRSNMSGLWHGFNEVSTKYLPNGDPVSTLYYYDVAPVDREND